MIKPICEECEKDGKKYSVTEPLYRTSTLMGITPAYWDEEGIYHLSVNPNTTTYTYYCSNGHSIIVLTDIIGHQEPNPNQIK